MPGLFKTACKFLRLRGSRSLFDRGYLLQFELSETGRPRAVKTDGLSITRDVCYHPQPEGDCDEQRLDIYSPGAVTTQETEKEIEKEIEKEAAREAQSETAKETARAVVVFMHGGGWRASDKQDAFGVHANICAALALRGLVAVNVNYRLSPRARHPAHALDVAHALRWVSRNIGSFGGDVDNIFASGHSSGGHLAALVTLDERYLRQAGASHAFIKGVIGVSGIYNIAHFAGRNRMAKSLMTRPAFGTDTRLWDEASPVFHARAGAPPFLMINAAEDERLEEEAEELAARLRAVGANADTLIIPGTNHFTILGFVGNGDDTLIEHVASFVKKNFNGSQSSNAARQPQASAS
jgi:acetyl esterase/lipase